MFIFNEDVLGKKVLVTLRQGTKRRKSRHMRKEISLHPWSQSKVFLPSVRREHSTISNSTVKALNTNILFIQRYSTFGEFVVFMCLHALLTWMCTTCKLGTPAIRRVCFTSQNCSHRLLRFIMWVMGMGRGLLQNQVPLTPESSCRPCRYSLLKYTGPNLRLKCRLPWVASSENVKKRQVIFLHCASQMSHQLPTCHVLLVINDPI